MRKIVKVQRSLKKFISTKLVRFEKISEERNSLEEAYGQVQVSTLHACTTQVSLFLLCRK